LITLKTLDPLRISCSNSYNKFPPIIAIVLLTAVVSSIIIITTAGCFVITAPSASAQLQQKQQQVALNAILAAPRDRWDILLKDVLQELKSRHPDINIQINYTVLPYNVTRTQILNALANKTAIDLISIDQIWLGDFAERGFLTDLTDYVKRWGRTSDWYQANFDGGVYKGKVYGVWAWTDIRAMWYWKDLLNQAGVNPDSLTTWKGYIASIKKINDIFRGQGIQGGLVVCGGAEWYPYLWMLGGDILVQKDGHPTKGTYWFPAYNSTAGIKAAEFLKDEVAAGIKPILSNVSGWDRDFINKRTAILMGGSWLPEFFSPDQRKDLGKIVGFLPLYPVPNQGNQTTTLLGGWELGIPSTSKNKELAWELLTIMVEPKILTSMLLQTGYLPTQKTIGQGPQSTQLNQTIPYYDKMISMIPLGQSRPTAPEFPQIDDHISKALDQVCSGLEEPKQALDDAARKSAKLLGW
jgi:multiple sugar transport system substrate-binding protein